MTAPWLPAAKSHWIDFKTVWGQLALDAWPRGMFKSDGDAAGDIRALGQSLGEARELLEWVLQTIWPQRDDDALWLDRWESAMGLIARTTTALRQSAILSYLRGYGAGDSERIKAIFAAVFDGDPSKVSFRQPSAAEITAANTLGDQTHSNASNSMHIYHADENVDPDLDLAADLMERNKPTWQTWTLGKNNVAKYDTQGAYNQAVYV